MRVRILHISYQKYQKEEFEVKEENCKLGKTFLWNFCGFWTKHLVEVDDIASLHCFGLGSWDWIVLQVYVE